MTVTVWYVRPRRKWKMFASSLVLHRVCIVWNICIALWYSTRSGKVIHLSLENKTKEVTEKSQSKIILAALFFKRTWIITIIKGQIFLIDGVCNLLFSGPCLLLNNCQWFLKNIFHSTMHWLKQLRTKLQQDTLYLGKIKLFLQSDCSSTNWVYGYILRIVLFCFIVCMFN